MSILKRIIIISVPLLVAACMSVPETPEAGREFLKDRHHYKRHTVALPYKQLVEHIDRKISECFNTTYRTNNVTNNGMSSTSNVTAYQTSSKIAAGKSEIAVQMAATGAQIIGPAKGVYVIVVDVVDNGQGTTLVDVYTGLPRRFVATLGAWANGKDQACPRAYTVF